MWKYREDLISRLCRCFFINQNKLTVNIMYLKFVSQQEELNRQNLKLYLYQVKHMTLGSVVWSLIKSLRQQIPFPCFLIFSHFLSSLTCNLSSLFTASVHASLGVGGGFEDPLKCPMVTHIFYACTPTNVHAWSNELDDMNAGVRKPTHWIMP